MTIYSLDVLLKKQRHHLAHKDPYSQSYGLSSRHGQMWELDHKEGRVPKNWCFWTVILEKTLESPLDSKEIKPVNPKGNQPWIFIGRTMLKLKLQHFGQLMQNTNSLEKTLMLRKTEGKRKRGQQRMRWLDGITNSMDWVWANARRQRRTGKPGMLQSTGLQTVRHDLETEQQYIEYNSLCHTIEPFCLFYIQ